AARRGCVGARSRSVLPCAVLLAAAARTGRRVDVAPAAAGRRVGLLAGGVVGGVWGVLWWRGVVVRGVPEVCPAGSGVDGGGVGPQARTRLGGHGVPFTVRAGCSVEGWRVWRVWSRFPYLV